MFGLFEQELWKLNFPNYKNYNEINEAYNDFIQKIMWIIDKVAPINGEIANEIKNRDKLFKKFKHWQIYNVARYKV